MIYKFVVVILLTVFQRGHKSRVELRSTRNRPKITMKTSFHVLASTLLLALSAAAQAGSIYALTTTNQLLVVDADVPQNILNDKTITGLDAGDALVGIDVRPATGQLYALGKLGRLYTINPANAAAGAAGVCRGRYLSRGEPKCQRHRLQQQCRGRGHDDAVRN